MAADILLYKATHVPVGGTKTTFELSRGCTKFNNDFNCKDFPFARTVKKMYQELQSLRDGTKMSNQKICYLGVNLKDSADEINKNQKLNQTQNKYQII